MDTELLQANGTAEREAALLMAERIEGGKRVTVAADKGYDAKEFVREIRGMNVTLHVAQNDRTTNVGAAAPLMGARRGTPDTK